MKMSEKPFTRASCWQLVRQGLPVTSAGMSEVALPGALELCLGFLAHHVDRACAVHHSHDAVGREMHVPWTRQTKVLVRSLHSYLLKFVL